MDGETFDSKAEYRRYCELKMMKSAGEIISDIERQRKFVIVPKKGKNPRVRYYIADFVYTNKYGEKIIEDVKSPITRKNPVYSLKRSLVLWQYPEYIFNEVM